MQQLSRISDKGTLYTDAQVASFIQSQTNQERWLFDQLDAELSFKADLTPFVDYDHTSPKISHDTTAAVKRNLQLTVRGDAPLNEDNFLSDIIRPRYQLLTPDGGYIEWVLGLFTLTPFDQDVYPGWTWHTIKSPDFSQLLIDQTLTTSFSAVTGANYLTAINSLVSSYGGRTPINVNITPTDKTIPATLGWEIGVPILNAVNDLLTAINYFPAWFDETGTLRSSPIPDYSTIHSSFDFDTTNNSSITMIPIKDRPDISKVYNQIYVVVEDPRRPSFNSVYTNDNPVDPVSRVNWHSKTLVVRDSKITDAATAAQRALAEGQTASRIFGKKTIATFPWALSQDRDVYGLIYNTPDEGLQHDLYVEMKWDMICKSGGTTTHDMDRIVQVLSRDPAPFVFHGKIQ